MNVNEYKTAVGAQHERERMQTRNLIRAIRLIRVHNCSSQHCLCTVVQNRLPPPPGWLLYMCHRCSGHVADTPVGEIPGYARLPPPAGVAKYLASGHCLRLWRRGGRYAAPIGGSHTTSQAKPHCLGASQFRFIRVIRVLDCFTLQCRCGAGIKKPTTGGDWLCTRSGT